MCSTLLAVGSISIHAPARGATCKAVEVVPHRVISIHAPARGATIDPEAVA